MLVFLTLTLYLLLALIIINSTFFPHNVIFVSNVSQTKPVISLNSINQLIFGMVKCYVFFEVRIECLNIIEMSFSFKELNLIVNVIITGSASWCWFGPIMLPKKTFASGDSGGTCEEAS
jgi:hypothetical protein